MKLTNLLINPPVVSTRGRRRPDFAAACAGLEELSPVAIGENMLAVCPLPWLVAKSLLGNGSTYSGARAAFSKPHLLCVPSQNGALPEWPQRHSA